MKLKNIKSFIEPRSKSSFNIRDIILASFIVLVVSLVLYLIFKPSSKINNTKVDEIVEQTNLTKADRLSLKLPNHKDNNLKKQKELANLVSVIPYDMVLSSLLLKDGNSTVEGEIIYKDSYYKEIKPKILKLYKSSSASMYKTNDGTYSISIDNKGIKEPYIPKQFHPKYKIVKQHSMKKLKDTVKLLLPKNSMIRFVKEIKTKDYIKNSFAVSTYIKSPKEIYDIIEKINSKPVCIVIEDELELNTYNSMIRINFNISFYQIIFNSKPK